ncbi:response regulator transcription factor [Vibrio sp. TH_r3]|uniref:response regulator transcription factor n=1 Tax=Vibrio sp. TH_r3 TaxID=3082084 RepID=UPI0029534CBA|nr:response regulator transcription factor [Vibrio sp. TH_r3]MDV7105959.1 response regulator transcription factor [Vibrio sp. TH_r3]
MMKNNINVICVKNTSTYSECLLRYLKKRRTINYQVVTSDDIEQLSLDKESCLYFIEFNNAVMLYKQIERLTGLNQQCFIIVYDAPINIRTSTLIPLGRLKGYFFSDISNKQFLSGIEAIFSGKNQLPKNISSQLIEYYQSLIVRFNQPYSTELTPREIVVLEYLRSGLSNNKLADELFISEHTVKSHLYKIFKKLSVSNRTQAIAWAHRYLP